MGKINTVFIQQKVAITRAPKLGFKTQSAQTGAQLEMPPAAQVGVCVLPPNLSWRESIKMARYETMSIISWVKSDNSRIKMNETGIFALIYTLGNPAIATPKP